MALRLLQVKLGFLTAAFLFLFSILYIFFYMRLQSFLLFLFLIRNMQSEWNLIYKIDFFYPAFFLCIEFELIFVH